MIAGQYGLALFFHFTFHLRKDTKSLVDGLIKLVFLFADDIEDKITFLFQLRITVF